MKTITTDQSVVLPKHVGIIMDGNRRWAKKRMLPVKAGHSAGAENFKKIARYANEIGIEYITFYAFSTENWKRSDDEVDSLMKLFSQYLRDSVNLNDENIKLVFIGDRSCMSQEIQQLMFDCEKRSAHCTGLTVYLAINYGGQDEIVHACKNIYYKINNGEISVDDVTTKIIDENIYTSESPALDLLIRSGGECRISNFMIWQAAYAELFFIDVLWPDFSPKEFDKAIKSFSNRNRRFGGS